MFDLKCPVCGHGRGHKDHTPACSKEMQRRRKAGEVPEYAPTPPRPRRPSGWWLRTKGGGYVFDGR